MRIKSALTEHQRMIKQLPYRIHLNDKILFKQLLRNDKLNYQSFIDACIQAYLRGDPVMLRFVNDWKELNTIPEEHKERYTLSSRERQKILDELEFDKKSS